MKISGEPPANGLRYPQCRATKKRTDAACPVLVMQRSSYEPDSRFRLSRMSEACRPLRNQVASSAFREITGINAEIPSAHSHSEFAVGDTITGKVLLASGIRFNGRITCNSSGGSGTFVVQNSREQKRRASRGSAVSRPTKASWPAPEKRPTQIPIENCPLWPTAHASRRPELVPVFHINHGSCPEGTCSQP